MSNLFPEFSKKTKAEWLAKIEKDLKGKPLDSLDWSPFEGLTMTPFFHAEDLKGAHQPLTNERKNNSWEIGEIVHVNDVKKANAQALEALEGGVTAIGFTFSKESPLPKEELSVEELSELLEGIQHEYISTNFYFKNSSVPKNFVEVFHEVILAKKQDPQKVEGTISHAPANLMGELELAKKLLPKFRVRYVQGDVFYEEKNPVKELELTFAMAFGHVKQLKMKEVSLAEIAESMQLSLHVGINYFLAIAKIRAFKLLWENLAIAYDEPDVECPPIEVHLAASSQVEDADTNKISTTTQAMAAIIGGASRLYLMPSDAFENEEGTPFSRRIARNVQHLLQLESYLDRVVDPAAGSYFIENLTDALAERAWDRFRGENRE